MILLTTSCAGEAPIKEARWEPTRGYILISLDTLAADHLGCYGYDRETSPFLDSLAARGVLFENAIVQYPSTLVSHVSMFTGLYPQEHGVYPPAKILSPAIETLPERFRSHGFATAGHTEGGFVARHYGFDRGFEEFEDPVIRTDRDVEATLERGVRFLRGLEPEERFFLFLHTYSIHDPYDPPEPHRSLFWQQDAPSVAESSKQVLREVNLGLLPPPADTVAYFQALYDGSIHYVDHELQGFFATVEAMGLLADTTVIITSDHGEEFLEHGKLGHEQAYPESLRVPLLFIHPEETQGARVADLVQSIDLAPTLYDLASIPLPAAISGRSLAPLLRSADLEGGSREATEAYAEVVEGRPQQALFRRQEGRTLLLSTTRPTAEPDGIWITRSVRFDAVGPELEFEAVSFHRDRRIEVFIDDELHARFALGTEWQPVKIPLPTPRSKHRLRLTTDSCESPAALDLSEDARCLSFKIRGLALERTDLFDLEHDPLADSDLSRQQAAEAERLSERLQSYAWSPLAEPEAGELPTETAAALRALGYIE